jgi:siderophore synthetase component
MADEQVFEKAREIHTRMTKDMWEVHGKHQAVEAGSDEDKINFVKFGRLSMISFAHVAAVLAVDTLMDEEKFLEVCRDNFRAAYAAAPKFT